MVRSVIDDSNSNAYSFVFIFALILSVKVRIYFFFIYDEINNRVDRHGLSDSNSNRRNNYNSKSWKIHQETALLYLPRHNNSKINRKKNKWRAMIVYTLKDDGILKTKVPVVQQSQAVLESILDILMHFVIKLIPADSCNFHTFL